MTPQSIEDRLARLEAVMKKVHPEAFKDEPKFVFTHTMIDRVLNTYDHHINQGESRDEAINTALLDMMKCDCAAIETAKCSWPLCECDPFSNYVMQRLAAAGWRLTQQGQGELLEVVEALQPERTETKTGAIIPPETIEKLEVSFREQQSCRHHNDGYNACTYCGTPLLPGTGMASSGGFPGPLRDGLIIAPSWKFVTVEAPDKLYYNVDRNYYSEGAIIHLPKLEKVVTPYSHNTLPDWYKYMYDMNDDNKRYFLKKEFEAWGTR